MKHSIKIIDRPLFLLILLATFLGLSACGHASRQESEKQVSILPQQPASKPLVHSSVKEDKLLFLDELSEMEMMQPPIGMRKKMSARPLRNSQGVGQRSMIFTAAPQDAIAHNTEEYDYIRENIFHRALENPLSTFSIDVDNAAYSNVRRYLQNGQMPPPDAARIEEMINYFSYNYREPDGKHPFSINTEVNDCPWNPSHRLVHIGLQGRRQNPEDVKQSNLVFLVDASGSMSSANKLPLLKSSLKLLLNQLDKNDRVAIVAYAGAAGLILPSTKASERKTILAALDNISAGGSTAGGQGIQLAYQVALKNLIENGNNRVVLATDGDFNVGTSSSSELVRLIEEKRKDDIYLTILGFGMGNYKDGRMEQISNAGNGNYFYIDSMREARKVFVHEMRANLFTIARDVKIQVEFNPSQVKGYRLVGYENRVLKNEDFNNDKKDAGELGAGHTVTALYEIIPAGSAEAVPGTDALKYQKPAKVTTTGADELLTVKFRYKTLTNDKSILLQKSLMDRGLRIDQSSENFRFSAAVAGFGMFLRRSKFAGDLDIATIEKLAGDASSSDTYGYRREFRELVKIAGEISG